MPRALLAQGGDSRACHCGVSPFFSGVCLQRVRIHYMTVCERLGRFNRRPLSVGTYSVKQKIYFTRNICHNGRWLKMDFLSLRPSIPSLFHHFFVSPFFIYSAYDCERSNMSALRFMATLVFAVVLLLAQKSMVVISIHSKTAGRSSFARPPLVRNESTHRLHCLQISHHDSLPHPLQHRSSRPRGNAHAPNILLMVADDLQPRDLSNGYTPNIDSIGLDGMNFVSTHAGAIVHAVTLCHPDGPASVVPL